MSNIGPEFIDLAGDAVARVSSAQDSDWILNARLFDPGALAKGKVGVLCLEAAANGNFDIGITADGLLTYSAQLGHPGKEAGPERPEVGRLNKVYGAEGLSRIEVDAQPFDMPLFTFSRNGDILLTNGDGLERRLGFWASRLLHKQLNPLYVIPR